jgi:hypothetical protein
MRKRFIVLLFAALAWSQRPQTIHQLIFQNITSTRASNPVRNMGAVSHLLMVQLSSQLGRTCSGGAVNIGLEASYDQLTWTPIGAQLTGITADGNGNLIGIATAQGAYPYVRVNVRSFDTTNCQLTAWYTGSQGPQSIVTLENQPTTMYSQYPTVNGQVNLATIANGACSSPILNVSGRGKLEQGLFSYANLAINGTPTLTLQLSTDGGTWVSYETLLTLTSWSAQVQLLLTNHPTITTGVVDMKFDHDFNSSLRAQVCVSGGTYATGTLSYAWRYAMRQ